MLNRPSDTELDFEIEELEKLTNAIMTKYGYDFSNYAVSSFKRRVLMVLKKNGLKSIDMLVQRLMFDPNFFEQFVIEITVNTTEMFRDPSFWKALRMTILPILNSRQEFNIWHAACSTGEEVLSMAILLKEEGMLERARIFATDINQLVLKRAAQGKVPVRSLELYTNNYKGTNPKGEFSDYYQLQDNEAVFDKSLLQNVRFKHHDLAVDHHFYKFDLIFCRNVMIYFNQYLQNRVFELFHNSLFLGGYLALGAKESLIWCKFQDKY
ncbi:MAG: protein-glutamate O-methyltransferase CheR, partial [Bacteroidia bacterium]|nr:protein-glutamate O-methyltransferase CheR [Bacteroidia bacterium]